MGLVAIWGLGCKGFGTICFHGKSKAPKDHCVNLIVAISRYCARELPSRTMSGVVQGHRIQNAGCKVNYTCGTSKCQTSMLIYVHMRRLSVRGIGAL